ncbi:hypothetical protein OGAPHI_004036 [Ogataea philodendri]|uniref:Uncharacterized protein n=1 Tax=Ogataea philodendri TaxID=1378263 RepID=A0A9P8P5F3_9ASCO|nr:uncharacterized protein OGAPHI_004036 [Ogataea philodendri]KAH3665848.1 hypothetical protein OGAPHI_004036 [Ogataea philodendri]
MIRDLGDIWCVSLGFLRLNGSLRLVGGWRESNGIDPVGVRFQGGHTLTLSVPQLNRLVSGSRNNLSGVGGNGNRQDIGSVTNKSTKTSTIVESPKSQGLIPRGRNGILSVSRDVTVLNNVGVSLEGLLGHTIVVLVSG